jgi:Ca2+-binding EF-hand superfamily protein
MVKKSKKNQFDLLKIDFDSLGIDFDDWSEKALNHQSKSDFESLNITELKERIKCPEKLTKLLKHHFLLFDNDNKGLMNLNDLKACICSLGMCPSESQFQEIFTELEKTVVNEKPKKKTRINKQNDVQDKVKYSDFESIVAPVFMSGKCLPKTHELLSQAFRKIRKNCSNKLCWTQFEDLIRTQGEKFSFDEAQIMKEFLGINDEKDEINSERYLQQSDFELENDLDYYYKE